MSSFDVRIVDLTRQKEVAAVAEFQKQFGLLFDGAVDYTIALFDKETIIATGSFSGKVLRNIAVDKDLQGDGLLSAVLSLLLQEQSRRGIFHSFIYTLPQKAFLFENLGFTEVVRAEPYAALLEYGIGSVSKFCDAVAKAAEKLPAGNCASLVVNCNPFTLGHKAVIGSAAAENDAVIVFVVSEDRSLFPFAERIRLVREGTAEYSNVVVVSGEDYIISAATFPAYFTRQADLVAAQTRLDATLFATRIAPALGITARYVGEEPYCPVTSSYNAALAEILPPNGIAVKIVPRIAVDGEIVSASKVRDLIRQDDWLTIQKMVPSTTYAYLTSSEAAPVLEKIKNSVSRH